MIFKVVLGILIIGGCMLAITSNKKEDNHVEFEREDGR